MRNFREAGDTIVEVLIVIAVISLVLAAAFVTSNRSLHSVQDAQEHGEAQTLVTGQLEELKSLSASSSSAAIFTIRPPFCITNNGSSLQPVAYVAAPPSPCIVIGSGAPASASAQPAYAIQISRSYDNTSAAYTFTVQATWASVFGQNSTNNVTMYYRLYKD